MEMSRLVTSVALAAVLAWSGLAAAAGEKTDQKPAAKAAEKPAAKAPEKPAAKKGGKSAGALVAKVNGVGISQAEFDRSWKAFMQQSGIPPTHQDKAGDGKLGEMRQKVVDTLVDQELLFQEAKQKKLIVTAEKVAAEVAVVEKRFPDPAAFKEALKQNDLTEESFKAYLSRNLSIQNLVEQDVAKGLTVSDAEAHDFYAGNKDKFETPEQVHARHILVKVDDKVDEKADEKTKAATLEANKEAARKKAEGLLKEVQGGADFAEVAKKGSDCPSAPKGGDLGFFPHGQMVEPFDKAAFGLKTGEMSGLVETQFGFHIIKVEERKEAGLVPEPEVAPEIKDYLKQQKLVEAVEARLKALRTKAKIEILLKP